MPFDRSDPANLVALKDEVVLPAYDGMTEPEIADALNERTLSANRDVPVIEARKIVAPTGEWTEIELLSETRPATSVAKAAMTFMRITDDRMAIIPAATKAAVDSMLSGLVTATVLSAPSKAALMALFDTQVSRGEQLFGQGTHIDSGDVSRAKAI